MSSVPPQLPNLADADVDATEIPLLTLRWKPTSIQAAPVILTFHATSHNERLLHRLTKRLNELDDLCADYWATWEITETTLNQQVQSQRDALGQYYRTLQRYSKILQVQVPATILKWYTLDCVQLAYRPGKAASVEAFYLRHQSPTAVTIKRKLPFDTSASLSPIRIPPREATLPTECTTD